MSGLKKLGTQWRLVIRMLSVFYRRMKNLFFVTNTIQITMTRLYYEPPSTQEKFSHLQFLQKMKQFSFKPGDIVYLRHNPRIRPSLDWPSIGSEYETDLKIIEVEGSIDNPNSILIISGRTGGQLRILKKEFMLVVPAKDKHLYGNCPTFEVIKDLDICPAGTIFFLSEDLYYSNDFLGIYVAKERFPQELLKPLNELICTT